jgi:SSS family solute:Na+ symporter
MELIDWFVFLILFLLIVWGSITAMKKRQTMFEFALDGQRTPAILVFATLSASFLGPGFTLGISEQGFINGPFYLMIVIGFSIQTTLVGFFLAPKLRGYKNAYTVGDIMGKHYGKYVKIITGFISVIYTAGIVGVCAKASGIIVESITGIPFIYGAISVTLFVVIYCTIGGMPSVIYTDIIQFIFLAIGISVLLLSIYFKIDDFDAFVMEIPTAFYKPFCDLSLTKYLGFFLGFFLGETLVPPYANRALISKKHTDAKKGFIYSGIVSIFWFSMCLTIGVAAKVLHPEIAAENAFLFMALNYLPIGFMGLLLIILVSILLSTISSFLNSGSVSFVRDCFESIKPISDSKSVYFARVTTLLIGLIAIYFAIEANSLVDGLLIAYTFWAPTIVLPLIIAIVTKGAVNKLSGLVAIIAGAISIIIWKWILNTPYDFPELLVGIVFNQIGFWITELILNNMNKNNFSVVK